MSAIRVLPELLVSQIGQGWGRAESMMLNRRRFASGLALLASAGSSPVGWLSDSGWAFFWCVFEAIIFTYVMTSLVIDTLSNLAGSQMTETAVRIPLFLFMFFVVLGSYAVLSTWTSALKSKDWGAIIKIGAVEGVARFVEVVFFYREFVDALVPWFAQLISSRRWSSACLCWAPRPVRRGRRKSLEITTNEVGWRIGLHYGGS